MKSKNIFHTDLKSTILVSETPVTKLLVDNKIIIDDQEVLFLTSDIDLLLNQTRLDNLGIDQINSWLSSLSSSQSSVIKGNYSDDELIALCKSRHIQSAQELLNWSEFLTSQYAKMKIDVQEQQEQQVTSTISDSSSSDNDNI